MSKRFTGTDIWGQDWFLDMPNEYKLFWRYILDECDHAGFYKVNTKSFGRLIESSVDADKALSLFNVDKIRVRAVKSGLWYIEDFIVFQYGTQLNPANRVHNSILKLLAQFDLNLTSIRGLKDLNDGLKDKDKDKDNSKEIGIEPRGKKFVPPTLSQVKQYFADNFYSENAAIAAHEYYEGLKWHDKEGTPVSNWKLKVRMVWFKEKDKIEQPLVNGDTAEFRKLFGAGRKPFE